MMKDTVTETDSLAVEEKSIDDKSALQVDSPFDVEPGCQNSATHLASQFPLQSQSQYSRADILSGFANIDLTSKLTLAERLQLLLVTLAVSLIAIFLLVVGVGLMLAASYLTQQAISGFLGNGYHLDAMFRLLLGVASLVMCLSLVRQLTLALRAQQNAQLLERSQHPGLYVLVDSLASMMRLRAPVAIKLGNDVTLQVKPKEAFYLSAGYRSELVMGLSLFYSLNVRQLAALITHGLYAYHREAAHYGLPFLQALLNGLMLGARVTPAQKTKCFPNTRLLFPCYLGSQTLLKACFWIATKLAAPILGKMNRRADLLSGKVLGSDEFRRTQRKLHTLVSRQDAAKQYLLTQYDKYGFPPQGYNNVLANQVALYSAELPQVNPYPLLCNAVGRGWLADMERILAVEKQQFEEGCFLLGSARLLLTDIHCLDQELTTNWYRAQQTTATIGSCGL